MSFFIGICVTAFFIYLAWPRDLWPTTLVDLSRSMGEGNITLILHCSPKSVINSLDYYLKNTEEDEYYKHAAVFKAFKLITKKCALNPDYCESDEEKFLQALWDVAGDEMRQKLKELTTEEAEHIQTLAEVATSK